MDPSMYAVEDPIDDDSVITIDSSDWPVDNSVGWT